MSMHTRWNNFRYYFLSFIYDAALFWFYKGYAKKLVGAVNRQQGPNVLEIGVGTGITLPFYGPGKKVTAIDPSQHMLSRAGKRLLKLPQVQVELVKAGAEQYEADAHLYEHIIFCNSLSVIHEPRQVLGAYFSRLKAGGQVYVLNHFTPEKGPLRLFDTLMTPVGRLLGFKSYFPLSALVDSSTMKCSHIRKGYWSIIQLSRHDGATV